MFDYPMAHLVLLGVKILSFNEHSHGLYRKKHECKIIFEQVVREGGFDLTPLLVEIHDLIVSKSDALYFSS